MPSYFLMLKDLTLRNMKASLLSAILKAMHTATGDRKVLYRCLLSQLYLTCVGSSIDTMQKCWHLENFFFKFTHFISGAP